MPRPHFGAYLRAYQTRARFKRQQASCCADARRKEKKKQLPAENRQENQLRRCSATRCGRAQEDNRRGKEKRKRKTSCAAGRGRAAGARSTNSRCFFEIALPLQHLCYRCTYIGVSTIYIVCRNARSTNSPCPRIRACIPRIRACTAALVYPPPSPLPAGRLVHFSDY